MINNIIEHDGSAQYIQEVLTDEQFAKCEDMDLFKTAWEMSMKPIIDQAADRGIYICQSQSMNLWVMNPTIAILSTMYSYAWKQGLKTGGYYLRSQSKAKAVQYTKTKKLSTNIKAIKSNIINETKKRKIRVCTEDVCTVCT